MALEFSEQVTVRVWRNIKNRANLPTSHFGHASVELRSHQLWRNDEKVHISYWPGGEGGAGIGKSALKAMANATSDTVTEDKAAEMGYATMLRLEIGYREKNGIDVPAAWRTELSDMGKSATGIQPRVGQKRHATPDGYGGEDDIFWAQSQDIKIKLPALRHMRGIWGLPVMPIKRWWDVFLKDNPSYRMLSTNRNCAGVALMALEAGGAPAFLPTPKIFAYAEPVQVERYAQGLRSVIEQMEIATKALKLEVDAAKKKGQLKAGGKTKDGLWTSEEWKKQSALGSMQVRSGAIRDIDAALSDFQSVSWAANYQKKFQGFVKMFRAICVHRQAKTDSARSSAILTLASQALALLEGNNEMHI